MRGFEPPTPCSRSRCATRLRYTPNLENTGAFAFLGEFGQAKTAGAMGEADLNLTASALHLILPCT